MLIISLYRRQVAHDKTVTRKKDASKDAVKFCNRLLTEILTEVLISHSLTEFNQPFNP